MQDSFWFWWFFDVRRSSPSRSRSVTNAYPASLTAAYFHSIDDGFFVRAQLRAQQETLNDPVRSPWPLFTNSSNSESYKKSDNSVYSLLSGFWFFGFWRRSHDNLFFGFWRRSHDNPRRNRSVITTGCARPRTAPPQSLWICIFPPVEADLPQQQQPRLRISIEGGARSTNAAPATFVERRSRRTTPVLFGVAVDVRVRTPWRRRE